MRTLSLKLVYNGNYKQLKNNTTIHNWESIITLRSDNNNHPVSDSVKITGELNNKIRQLFKKYSSFINIDSHILYDKNHTPIIYNIYYKDIPIEYHNDFEQEVLSIRREQLEKENNHKKELIELL